MADGRSRSILLRCHADPGPEPAAIGESMMAARGAKRPGALFIARDWTIPCIQRVPVLPSGPSAPDPAARSPPVRDRWKAVPSRRKIADARRAWRSYGEANGMTVEHTLPDRRIRKDLCGTLREGD